MMHAGEKHKAKSTRYVLNIVWLPSFHVKVSNDPVIQSWAVNHATAGSTHTPRANVSLSVKVCVSLYAP